MGLLLCSAGDLFPLTIPRWRWGMRILQGNSSPPLGNRPSPNSSKTLSRTQQGRQRLKDSQHPTSKYEKSCRNSDTDLTRKPFCSIWFSKSPWKLREHCQLFTYFKMHCATLPIIHNTIYQISPFLKAAQKTGPSAQSRNANTRKNASFTYNHRINMSDSAS